MSSDNNKGLVQSISLNGLTWAKTLMICAILVCAGFAAYLGANVTVNVSLQDRLATLENRIDIPVNSSLSGLQKPFDYIISMVDTYYCLQNGTDGKLNWFSVNKTNIEAAAIGNLTTGGTILLKGCTLDTQLAYPSNVLIVESYHGTVTYYGYDLQNFGGRPQQLPFSWADLTCALVNDVFYLFGGYSPNAASPYAGAYKYSTSTNTYAQLANTPVAHGYGAIAIAVNATTIYLIGGANQPTRVDAYNIPTNTWTGPLATAPHSYAHGPIGCYNLNNDGRIHVFNGDPNTAYHDVYDVTSNSWTSGTASPNATQFSTLGIRSDGRVVILGGTPAPLNNRSMIYDPIADSWTLGLSSYPVNPQLGKSALVYGAPRENPVWDDKLFIVTGQNTYYNSRFEPRCYIYDMYLDTYTEIAPINGVPRDGCAGTFCRNKLYVFGGRFATANDYAGAVDASPFVDVLTVTKNGNNEYMTVWSQNEWTILTWQAYDPGGGSFTPPYTIARWAVCGQLEFVYTLRADVLTPSIGNAGQMRVYSVYDTTTSTTIDQMAINANATQGVGGFWCTQIGSAYNDGIALRVASDNCTAVAANIMITIQMLVCYGNRIIA